MLLFLQNLFLMTDITEFSTEAKHAKMGGHSQNSTGAKWIPGIKEIFVMPHLRTFDKSKGSPKMFLLFLISSGNPHYVWINPLVQVSIFKYRIYSIVSRDLQSFFFIMFAV